MAFNKETRPEKREQHAYEQPPKKKDSTVRELGKKAIEGASKDKSKK